MIYGGTTFRRTFGRGSKAVLLETRLADLRMEIGDTVPLAYRDMLRKKKKVLEKTVACLRSERFLRVEPMDPKVPRV